MWRIVKLFPNNALHAFSSGLGTGSGRTADVAAIKEEENPTDCEEYVLT